MRSKVRTAYSTVKLRNFGKPRQVTSIGPVDAFPGFCPDRFGPRKHLMEEFGCGPDWENEMLTRIGSRVRKLGLVLCATGTMYACAPASRTTDDLPIAYPMQVDNRTDFEVVIYAMRSGSTRGQRLGTARPFGKTVLSIPTDALMGQELFAVQLHAIGAPPSVPNWVSYVTVVRSDLMAQLDIFGDGSGNLRMSTLTTRMPRTYK